MRKLLTYILAILLLAISCADSGTEADLELLRQQLEDLKTRRDNLKTDAETLETLIAAVQKNDALVGFEPLAENGLIVGFKAVFKDAGTVTVYNRNSSIGVFEKNGKYYWMAGGEPLLDGAGNMVEIAPEMPLPQFRVNDGNLEVSVDGGNSFKPIGGVDKCLITSVTEDAVRVVFTISGGAQIIIPKYQALSLSLSGDQTTIGAGDKVTVTYEIEGAENAEISVLCGSGWNSEVTAQTATTGTITVKAPNPIAEDKVIVFVSDGKGRTVAVEMRLTIDTSGNPDPPTPPDPPAPEIILMPVKTSYNVAKEGGEVVAGLLTNVEYEVVTDKDWIHYTGTKAVRTDNLAFNVEANEGDIRSATATISSGNYSTQIAFVQAGISRYLTVSPKSLSFDFEDEEKTLFVFSNVQYSYEISDSWVNVEIVQSSTEDCYEVTVEDNPVTEPRTATITFSGNGVQSQTVTVQQAAKRYVMTISKETMEFRSDGGSNTLKVKSNADYSVSSSAGWLTVSGTPAQGIQTFTVSATANASYDARSATVTFISSLAGNCTLEVTQQGKAVPMPSTSGGVNLFTAPSSGWHYRYGPTIITYSDGSMDIWTSKPGGNYLYYGEYAYQDTGTRTKKSAHGHTFAQYFNIQHKFASIQLRLYGTSSASDKIVIKLYQWAGSYAATVAGTPIATRTFNNISSGGNRYRVYKSDQTMMPSGEYLWTATEATDGVGIYAYSGAGTISITDAVSYLDGVSTDAYNYEMRPRGRTTTNYANVDKFAWWHSTDGGASFTGDRDVLFGTEGFEDEYSVCDPGAAYFGGWYYLGYTSAPGAKTGYVEGNFNHCYLARSRTPKGPWYKWNGSGWGGEPAKVVEFTGDVKEWGAGEPCIVVKDNTVYFYHSWVEGWQDGETWVKPFSRKTYVWTAPIGDDWPAHLTFRGVAMDQSALPGCDSADIKYVEDYGLFYAFHTYYRMTSSAKIAVWTSSDGINFTLRGNFGGALQAGAHNMGVSGDGQGYIRLSEPQYVSYAYGVGTWGLWSTWFAPMVFK